MADTNKLKMIKDYCLILPDKEESVIVRVNEDRPKSGTVIDTGPGWLTPEGKLLPMPVKKGDRVLFKPETPDIADHDGKEHLLLREAYILAVIE